MGKQSKESGRQYGGNPMVECISKPVTGWWDHPAYANDPRNPKVRRLAYTVKNRQASKG